MPEYKGIPYELTRPAGPLDPWRWVAHLANDSRSGQSPLKYSAEQAAKRAIDKALKRSATDAAE